MNRFFTLIALCFTLSVTAQDLKLSGKVTNPISDSIIVSYAEGWLEYAPKQFATRLAGDGTFSVSVPVPEPITQMNIVHGEQQTEVFIEPGYELYLTVDAKDFDNTLHYKGKGMHLANFMAGHMKQHGFMNDVYRRIQPLFKKEPKYFPCSLDSLLAREKSFIDSNRTGLSKNFQRYWDNHFLYYGYYNRLTYPRTHEIMKKQSYDIGEIPDSIMIVARETPMVFNDAFLPISIYRIYVDTYFPATVRFDAADQAASVRKMDSLVALGSTNMPAKTFEYYNANNIYRYIKYSPLAKSEADLKTFRSRYPQSTYLPALEKEFAQKKKLSGGQPAIDINIVDIDGKKIKLADYKGKVVFLDFWASWCGPCIAEMPHAKKVKEHFKDNKNVVFLYISIDESEENWKKAIEKHEIKGIHARDGGGWQAPVSASYGINGIPAYFLIDKKGKFALDTTPRPSNTETLIAEIEKLLK